MFDTFGNSATKNYSFTIRSDAQTPEIRLAGSDTVTMGGTYTLTLTATDALKNATVELAQLNTQFGEPTVAFAAGYTGSYTYEETGFRKAALHLEAERREETAGTELCTITFRVPSDLDPEIDFFTYQPVTIRYTAVDGASYSAAQPYRKLALSAYYTIVPGMQTEGDSSTVTVLDSDGKPAADVSIFLNGTEIGKTDAAGKLVTDAMGRSACRDDLHPHGKQHARRFVCDEGYGACACRRQRKADRYPPERRTGRQHAGQHRLVRQCGCRAAEGCDPLYDGREL